MKKKWKAIIVIILFLAASVWYSYIDKMSLTYDKAIDADNYVCEGVLLNSLERDFTSNAECMDGIAVKCAVNGDYSEVKVNYILSEKDTDKVIVEDVIDTSKVKNNQYYKIKFPRLENTRGKEYHIIFSAEKSDKNNGIGFYKLFDEEGKLVLKTFKTGFDIETFSITIAFVIYVVAFIKILYKLFK